MAILNQESTKKTEEWTSPHHEGLAALSYGEVSRLTLVSTFQRQRSNLFNSVLLAEDDLSNLSDHATITSSSSSFTTLEEPQESNTRNIAIVSCTVTSQERQPQLFQSCFPKRVSFAPTELLESVQDTPAEHYIVPISDIWFTASEMKSFRFLAQLQALSCREEAAAAAAAGDGSLSHPLLALEESHSTVLRLAAHLRKRRTPKRDQNEEAFLWNQIHQRVDAKLENGVVQWSFTNHRGLESHSSILVRRHKWSTRRKMRDEVLSQSSREVQEIKTRAPLSWDELAGRLERRSQASRLFARLVGQSDELAAKFAAQQP